MVLQNGDKEARDNQGWTLLDLAAFYKHEDVVKVLDPDGNVNEFAWLRVPRINVVGIGFSTPPLTESIVSGMIEAPTPIDPNQPTTPW